MKIILNESQLNRVSGQIIDLGKSTEFKIKWESLSEENKKYARDIIDTFYPNHYGQINEAWWNTIGDVVGIFDPTGIVDFVNGIDYIRQGEYFFGLLSMVAIVPYVGDLVAKPLTAFAKTGKMKGVVNQALDLVRKGDNAQAVKLLQSTAQSSPRLYEFIRYAEKWGVKLKEILRKVEAIIPGGKLTSGLRQTIENWIDIFIQASKSITGSRRIVGRLARKIKKLSPDEAEKIAKEYKKLLSRNARPVTYNQIKNPDFMMKYVWPGLLVRGKNARMLAGMMRRTKFYAGLLDYLGIANFVGPEELINKVGEEAFKQEFQNYMKTTEAKQYYQEDMSGLSDQETFDTQTPTQPVNQPTQDKGQSSNPLTDFLSKQLFGI